MSELVHPHRLARAAPASGTENAAALLTIGAIFLSPYTTWRLVPGTLFTVSDGLFGLAALMLLVRARLNLHLFGDLTPLWLSGLGLLVLGLLVGTIVNGDPDRWLIVAAQYCFAYGLLPIVIGSWNRHFLVDAALALATGVVAMELFGICVYAALGGSYVRAQAFGPEFITGGHRLGGFMADANWNGAISAMAIPFVMFLHGTGRIGSARAFLALFILYGGVILSGSFTGFAAAAAATMLFLAGSRDRRIVRLLLSLMLLATAALAAGTGLPTAFRERVSAAIETGDIEEAGTFVGRMQLVREAWEIVDRTPLVGIGVDRFRTISPDEAPVHNMYLLVWAEGGFFSLIGWLMMILTPVIAVGRSWRSRPRRAGLAGAVTAVFLIFSLAAPHMYARSWVVPLLVGAAILTTDRNRKQPA
jgi:O-antigen ligase